MFGLQQAAGFQSMRSCTQYRVVGLRRRCCRPRRPFEDLIQLGDEGLFERQHGPVGRGRSTSRVGERGQVEREKDLARVAFR